MAKRPFLVNHFPLARMTGRVTILPKSLSEGVYTLFWRTIPKRVHSNSKWLIALILFVLTACQSEVELPTPANVATVPPTNTTESIAQAETNVPPTWTVIPTVATSTPAPTMPPPPTSTPVPTSTLPPTATDTPIPTDTPEPTATATATAVPPTETPVP
ncbi:MAG: hypothetical protein D6706_13890 [Chloroflexi bacterium]|nr:MAG: hypothetical protein D6706_13890 [Chloroflexota bacterium]